MTTFKYDNSAQVFVHPPYRGQSSIYHYDAQCIAAINTVVKPPATVAVRVDRLEEPWPSTSLRHCG